MECGASVTTALTRGRARVFGQFIFHYNHWLNWDFFVITTGFAYQVVGVGKRDGLVRWRIQLTYGHQFSFTATILELFCMC